MKNLSRSDFPKGFLFGCPVSAASAQGFDLCRVQICWRDLLPDGWGQIDPLVADRIDREIDKIVDMGLRPELVLSHSALPEAMQDLGGWRNRDVAHWFADFAESAVIRFGTRAFHVAPGGLLAPAADETRAEIRGLHHRLLAHGLAIKTLRGYGMTNLGCSVRASTSDVDQILSPLFNRAYPHQMTSKSETLLPAGWMDDLETIAEPVDWCSLHINATAFSRILPEVPAYTGTLPIHLVLATKTEQELAQCLQALQVALSDGVLVHGLSLTEGAGEGFDCLHACLRKDAVPAPWAIPSGMLHAHWNLVADIGGTNTRLGVVTNGRLTDLRRHPTGTLEDLRQALHALRDEIGTDPRAVVAAGAGPVKDGTIRLTNAHLDLSEAELARATGSKHTFVINDFTAAAWSVAEITSQNVEVLQGEANPPKGTRLVVGPGTGLGVGALLYSEGHYHTVSGEGGHMGLSPRHPDEVAVFEAARQIVPECFFGDSLAIEAEMLLSGTGLPILYRAIRMAAGRDQKNTPSARDILQNARCGSDPDAERTAAMFTEHLGALIGDIAVTLMPAGGVFLVGGVAEKNRWLFGPAFRAAFNAGGRFDELRQSLNLYVSEQEEFGIVGANNFCKNALSR